MVWRSTVRLDVTASPTRTSSTPSNIRSSLSMSTRTPTPKVLVIGPELSSNLLELFVLELADDRLLTIHAMPLRRSFHDLLPKPEDRDV